MDKKSIADKIYKLCRVSKHTPVEEDLTVKMAAVTYVASIVSEPKSKGYLNPAVMRFIFLECVSRRDLGQSLAFQNFVEGVDESGELSDDERRESLVSFLGSFLLRDYNSAMYKLGCALGRRILER